jgi:hypothetical protein
VRRGCASCPAAVAVVVDPLCENIRSVLQLPHWDGGIGEYWDAKDGNEERKVGHQRAELRGQSRHREPGPVPIRGSLLLLRLL